MNVQSGLSLGPSRLVWGIIGVLAVVLGIGALLTLPSSGSSVLLVRGVPADTDTFSLTTLQDPHDRALVEATRENLYQTCMEAKGFPEPPAPDASEQELGAYVLAGSGDDPSATKPPPPRVVEIAKGVQVQLGVTWTPESCMYQSFASLGVDPFVREATRQQMQLLLIEGDRSVVNDLHDVTSSWADCLGQDSADPQDLLNTIDSGADRNPFGRAAVDCLSDELESEAMRIRAKGHIAVAVQHQEVVDAWVRLVDTEIEEARAAGP